MPDNNVSETSAANEKTVKRPRLGLKLLAYVLAFSFVVTLATSGYILYSDYRQGASELDRSIEQIQAGYQQSISYSLWNFDNQQIKTQLSGILNFPGVVAVFIETNEGLLHSAGDFDAEASRTYAFDLLYSSPEREYPLGILSITLNFDSLYKALMYKAANIVITQFVKTFSVSLFILFIFQRLVTRRLQTMSEWAQQFDINNLDNALELHPKYINPNTDDDEIDEVVGAINSMRVILKDDIKQRTETEFALKAAQHKLNIAVNNAELGFCEYDHQHNKMKANEHFIRQLHSTSEEISQLEHPLDWFKDLIAGDNTIEQSERINQLAHGHMERICTELTLRLADETISHFDATIQVAEWEESGLPATIVFCLLDTTQEVEASRQAAELNLSLEQKVTKRTEELSQEQIKSKARIIKLEKNLQALELQRQSKSKREAYVPLRFALQRLEELSTADNNDEKTAERSELFSSFNDYLDAQCDLKFETFDLVEQIRSLTNITLNAPDVEGKPNLALPFSLMLDSYRSLITRCLSQSILCIKYYAPTPMQAEDLNINLSLQKDSAEILINYNQDLVESLSEQWEGNLSNPIIALKMCQQLMKEHTEGDIQITTFENRQAIRLMFSINLKPLKAIE